MLALVAYYYSFIPFHVHFPETAVPLQARFGPSLCGLLLFLPSFSHSFPRNCSTFTGTLWTQKRFKLFITDASVCIVIGFRSVQQESYESWRYYSSTGDVGLLIMILAALALPLASFLRGKGKGNEPHDGSISEDPENVIDICIIGAGKRFHFTLELIKTATNNFDKDHNVGMGAFGVVYKTPALVADHYSFLPFHIHFPETAIHLQACFGPKECPGSASCIVIGYSSIQRESYESWIYYSSTEKAMNPGYIIVALGAVGLLIMILAALALPLASFLKRKGKGNEPHDGSISEDPENVTDIRIIGADKRFHFTFELIKTATNNFDKDHNVGMGAFGVVYKGTMPNGREIAVKKLLESCQSHSDFVNEIKVLAQIQHRNLVSLLGFCLDRTQKMLVCEYMVNGSLDNVLFDHNKKRQFDWPKRSSIIQDVAQGLKYLHQSSRVKIIHRDIKASNILLDAKFNAKIADFGLARFFPEDKTYVLTRRIIGTRGYIAPEYMLEGRLSRMIDVYSFGVLMLEIIGGRTNTDLNLPLETQSLLRWTWMLYERDHVWEMVDEFLKQPGCTAEEEILRFIEVALLCTQGDPTSRPTMTQVIKMLSSSAEALAKPENPPFQDLYISSPPASAATTSLESLSCR